MVFLCLRYPAIIGTIRISMAPTTPVLRLSPCIRSDNLQVIDTNHPSRRTRPLGRFGLLAYQNSRARDLPTLSVYRRLFEVEPYVAA